MKFLTFVTFFFFSAVLNAESSVDFKDTVTASPQGQLSLYDLIEPKSYEVVSSIKDKLSQTIIIEIQKSGEHITLSSQSIVEHLKFALTPEEKAEFRFSIPRRIEVTIKVPELTEKYLSELLKKEWQPLCGDCKVEVREIKLPIGEFSNWDLVIPKNIPKGSFNLPLVVRGKNGLEARYWIQGKVDILKEVPIAERSLSMGERVQLEDFRYQWQSITHATDGPPSKNLLVGLKIKIPVNANQVIWSRHLEKDKALKKGDQVRVFSKEGTWELSTLAIAEKDAELGDRVNLKTSGNKKILSGIVVGKGEVQVK